VRVLPFKATYYSGGDELTFVDDVEFTPPLYCQGMMIREDTRERPVSRDLAKIRSRAKSRTEPEGCLRHHSTDRGIRSV
jgi:hypothetical protein